MWEVHAIGAGVEGAEGAGPVVDVLQDELANFFEVFEVEISCDGLMQNALVARLRVRPRRFSRVG